MQAGNHGEKEYVAYLLQGGLGLPDRELYLGADPRMQARRVDYQAAIGDVLARLGSDGARVASIVARRAEAVKAPPTPRSSASPRERRLNNRSTTPAWIVSARFS